MHPNQKKYIQVGAFVGIAIAMLIAFVFSIGGDQSLFQKKIRYQIKFNSTTGLYEGDPVLLTGVEVGNVEKIRFPESIDEMKIIVEITVDPAVASRIRQDTRARIASASIVYGKTVSLTVGSPQYPTIPENGFIPVDDKAGFSAVVDSTNLVIGDIRSVISKIDRGEGALGVLLNDPLEMRKTLHHLSVVTEQLSRILTRVDRGEGALGAMVADSSDFHQSLMDFSVAAADLKSITYNLRSDQSLLGKMINDSVYGDTVSKDLAATLHALASITTKIDTGKGAAGSFVNDNSVYEGLQHVVLGMEKSALTKWIIQGRRKAGEKAEREAIEKAEDEQRKQRK